SLTYGSEVWDNGEYGAIDAVQADLARKVMGTYKKNIPIAGLLADLGWRKTSTVMKKKRLLYTAHIRSPDAPPLLKSAAYWVREGRKLKKNELPNWETRTRRLMNELNLSQKWQSWCEGGGSK